MKATLFATILLLTSNLAIAGNCGERKFCPHYAATTFEESQAPQNNLSRQTIVDALDGSSWIATGVAQGEFIDSEALFRILYGGFGELKCQRPSLRYRKPPFFIPCRKGLSFTHVPMEIKFEKSQHCCDGHEEPSIQISDGYLTGVSSALKDQVIDILPNGDIAFNSQTGISSYRNFLKAFDTCRFIEASQFDQLICERRFWGPKRPRSLENPEHEEWDWNVSGYYRLERVEGTSP